MPLPPLQQQGEYALDHDVQTQVVPVIVHQHVSHEPPDLVTFDRFESKDLLGVGGEENVEADLKWEFLEQ